MRMIETLSDSEREAQNAEYQAMLALVGRALSYWVDVERQVAQTFHYAITLGPRSNIIQLQGLHTQILNKAVNFRNRLDMVDTAVVGRLAREPDLNLLEDWKVLVRKTERLSAKRNKLAHRQVAVVVDRRFVPAYRGDLAVRLSEPFPDLDSNDPDYVAKRLADGLTMREITEIKDAFVTGAFAIQEHGKRLLDHIIPYTGT